MSYTETPADTIRYSNLRFMRRALALIGIGVFAVGCAASAIDLSGGTPVVTNVGVGQPSPADIASCPGEIVVKPDLNLWGCEVSR